MKKILFISSLMLLCCGAFAQEDPIYSQYMNNTLLINPAYAGSNKTWQTVAGARVQWTGLAGSPNTVTLSSNISLFDNKVGGGFSIIQDNIGEVSTTDVTFDYSYKIGLNKGFDFYFGLSTGFVRYSSNPNELSIHDPTDPLFAAMNKTQFNTGVGLMLKSNSLLIGFSVPKLLPNTIKSGSEDIHLYKQHYYLTASYLEVLNSRMLLKPSMLLRATAGAPVSVDANALLIFNHQVAAGLLTRNFSTFGLMMQLWVKQDFKFGYVFELPTGRSVGANFTSHELTLTWSKAVLPAHSIDISHF